MRARVDWTRRLPRSTKAYHRRRTENPSAEVLRLSGRGASAARRCNRGCRAIFREAIEVARELGARRFELRATTSLARLLAKQGKRDEARAMLADIYNWFTEGFDTADLKDAKALLDELGR